MKITVKDEKGAVMEFVSVPGSEMFTCYDKNWFRLGDKGFKLGLNDTVRFVNLEELVRKTPSTLDFHGVNEDITATWRLAGNHVISGQIIKLEV